MELDYNVDLKIDDSKLDKEWVNQPFLYKMYSDAWAKAEDERIQIKEILTETRLSLAKQYRQNPPVDDKGKAVKLTVDSMTELVETDTKVIELKKKFNSATYNVNVLENTKKSFEQRKKALEKLVDLWGMQYFGKPKNNTQRNSTVEENTQHSRSGLKQRDNQK